MDETTGEITKLLKQWGTGDRQVEPALFELVLPDLHKLARYIMQRERQDNSMQATSLLNETYFKLVNARERDWENRRHFFAIAARAMRRLVIDHARARPAGGKVPIDLLGDILKGRDAQLEQAVAINKLLDELEGPHPDWCLVIELKFFLGLTDDEAAEAAGISLRSLQRQYADARRWLFERLNTGGTWPGKNTTKS